MMNGYAVEAGLRQRPIAALPVLTPWLASQWVNLVTPDPALARGADHRVAAVRLRRCASTTSTTSSRRPPEGLTGYRRAVRLALRARAATARSRRAGGIAEVAGAPSDPLPSDPDWAGPHGLRRRARAALDGAAGRPLDGHRGHRRRERLVLVPARLGGARLARQARRRRRPPPRPARSRHDCTSATPSTSGGSRRSTAGSFLRLRAEMRVPGPAWLELAAEPDGDGGLGTASAPCSSRRGSRVGCTGARSCRSTASSSRAWRTASPPRPRRRGKVPRTVARGRTTAGGRGLRFGSPGEEVTKR